MSCSLTVRDLSIKRNGCELFSGVSFRLGHKDKVALMGPNGIGKTSLLKSIVGLCPVASGTIEIFHKPLLTEADFKETRKHVGFLFQDSDDQFIAPTVIEEVAFGLLNERIPVKEAIRTAEEMLERLNISHLRDRVTLHLSGGEKKLTALASVLVTQPDILLLDEPSTALDERSANQLAEILNSLDKSILIVSHNPEFVKNTGATIMNLSKEGLQENNL